MIWLRGMSQFEPLLTCAYSHKILIANHTLDFRQMPWHKKSLTYCATVFWRVDWHAFAWIRSQWTEIEINRNVFIYIENSFLWCHTSSLAEQMKPIIFFIEVKNCYCSSSRLIPTNSYFLWRFYPCVADFIPNKS